MAPSLACDDHRPGPGGALHPRGDVHRVAQRIDGASGVTHALDDREAGVDAYTDLRPITELLAEFSP